MRTEPKTGTTMKPEKSAPPPVLIARRTAAAVLNAFCMHTRGKGFRDDMLKYHHAMRLGWTIYRCEAELVTSGQAVNLLERLLEATPCP